MAESRSIFISYHRADAGVARQIRDDLARRGASTWMDEFDIPAGAYWPDEIDKGLGASDTVIGLLSPDSIDSRNVKNEWDWALQNGRHLLLLLVRPCVIPHRYVSINFIDATVGELVPAIDALCVSAGLPASIGDHDPAHPKTHYARSGDGSVAYQVFGHGPVDLVIVPGFISHVEHGWTEGYFATFLRRLGTLARVTIFDKRGTGLSDRIGRVLTMEERMDDIRAVMDAAQMERAVIYGVSEGGSLAALFAATYPERTTGLMIYAGLASYIARPDYPWPPTREEYHQRTEEMAQTLHERWGTDELAAEIIELMAPSGAGDPHLVEYMAALMRLGASPGAEVARRRMNIELDTRAVFPTINVPAMVMHRTGDRDVNIEEGKYIASRIPGCKMVELEGNDHVPSVGDQEVLFGAIESFLNQITAAPESVTEAPQKLATVMCMVLPLGGLAADGDVEREIAAALEKYGGQTVEQEPRRLTAVFDGSIRAIRSALAIGKLMDAAGSEARFALHTGHVETTGAPAQGGTVEIARQLASMARAGSVLATANVKNISPGAGIEFVDLGEQQLDGLDQLVSVFLIQVDR